MEQIAGMPILNPKLTLAEIDRHWPDLRAGMHSPECVVLEPQKLYRFSSRCLVPEKQISSPWWFGEADFKKLAPFLSLDSFNPGFIARLQGAVCYEWSTMDVLLTAELAAPIRVFQGPGKIQVERNKSQSVIIFQPPQDLSQTYIPGVRPGVNQPCSSEVLTAIKLVRRDYLAGPDAIDRAIANACGKMIFMPGNPRLH